MIKPTKQASTLLKYPQLSMWTTLCSETKTNSTYEFQRLLIGVLNEIDGVTLGLGIQESIWPIISRSKGEVHAEN